MKNKCPFHLKYLIRIERDIGSFYRCGFECIERPAEGAASQCDQFPASMEVEGRTGVARDVHHYIRRVFLRHEFRQPVLCHVVGEDQQVGERPCIRTKRTPDLVTGLNGMLQYFGGVSSSLPIDNAKNMVVKSDRYEPRFTELCRQLGEHYGTVLSATRPYSPRDKGMVEGAVKIVYSAVYAPLAQPGVHLSRRTH